LGLASLALRNVSRNRRRTVMALTGIGIGVAAMISLRAFVTGQQELFLNGLVNGHLGALQVHRRGYLDSLEALPLNLDFEDTPALRSALLSVPGVTATAGRIVFGAMLSTPPEGEAQDSTSAFLMLTGIEPELERRVCPQRFKWVAQGRVFDEPSARELWLNADLARSVGLAQVPAEHLPAEERWPVLLANDRDNLLNGEAVAMTATLLSTVPGDRRVGYVALKVAQRLLRMEGRVTELAVGVESLDQVPRIQADLQAKLGNQFEVHTWVQLMPFLKGLLNNMDLTFGISTGLMMLVVLLGLLNAMLSNVLERQREIGMLLAIGLRRSQITALFLLEGAAVGALGGLLGVALGAAVVLSLHSTGITIPIPGSDVPAVVTPTLQPLVLVATFTLAVPAAAAATLWPAVRASRLRPIQALNAR
jgi:putative ABC transport system permease protein